MLKARIYFAPSAFELGFMSLAHGVEEIEKTISSERRCFAQSRF